MIKTLSDALEARGYHTLTAVQEAVTAPELQDADLLVSAQTGSGKTVGFGLAIAHTLMGEAEQLGAAAAPLALVVAPTRELAFQVMRELGWLYAGAGARVVSCVGGMDMRDERRALERGAHIVVGTPGRLRDHIQRGSLDMTALRAVVLDEADEMLDLGFREDLEFMLGEAPVDRRTLMFSATVPQAIATLARGYQRDAVRVQTTTGASQHADIAYQAVRVAEADAENAIVNILRFHDAQNAIVFANTRMAVNRLAARFSNRGFAVVSLSGELSQTERTHALQAMRDGRARVCVATDVAARGIDLPNLELVVHADLPSNPEGLLHRSGRTGRAGRKGISALIVTPRTVKKAERLLQAARISAEWTVAPSAEEILRRDEERLLADSIWSDEISDEQAAFADKLMALHDPRTIAAAYLRLYRSRQSAPEDLLPPDTRATPKERKPFGPSVWVALSVGRAERAEARWLLPLLCRAGGLDKDSIGAIRVQQSETFVELAEPAAAGFLDRLGDGGALDEGVTVRKLDGVPDGASPRPDRPLAAPVKARPRADAPPRKPAAPRPEAAPQAAAPAPAADTPPIEARAAAPAPEVSRPSATAEQPAPRSEAPRARPSDRPDRKDFKPRDPSAKPRYGEGKPRDAAKPRYGEGKPRDAAKPRYAEGKPRDAAKPRYGDDKPRETAKPRYGEGKPRDADGKPKGTFARRGPGDAPRGKDAKWERKGPGARSGGKPQPGGASDARKADKPASTFRAGAGDSSQRVARPGKPAKPRSGGAKPGKPRFPKEGGGQPPRRDKR